MMMRAMAMLALLAAASASADVRFHSAQPISVDRVGITGAHSGNWSVTGGDDTFLLLWHDDRHLWSPFPNSGYMAMRLDASGTPLDEVPLFVPILVQAVVRVDGGWIVLGPGGIACLSDEGTLGAVQPMPPIFGTVEGAAWTGQAVVVLTAQYSFEPSGVAGSSQAFVFDRDLRHVATHQLSLSPTYGLGAAGDGAGSAMLLYQRREDGGPIRAALFDAGGEFRRDKIIHSLDQSHPDGAIAAIGPGQYALAIGPHRGSSNRLEVMTLDTNFRKKYAGTLDGHWFPFAHTVRFQMFRDGSAVRIYSLMHDGVKLSVAASHFIPGDAPKLVTEKLHPWDSGDFVVAQASHDSMLVKDGAPLQLKAFREPAGMNAGAPFRMVTVERGAFAQGEAAGVSGATQSVVTWMERASITGPLAVYATRLDRNGNVLDPQSLPLGHSPCQTRPPLLATNGNDFLAVWTSQNTRVAAIHADGSFEQRSFDLRTGTDCTTLQLASNGEDFLLVWPEKPSALAAWDLVAARLQSDGTPIDSAPFVLARAFSPANAAGHVALAIASDGRDYLVAWNKFAVRVTNDGAVLNRFQPIVLGGTAARAWWNGQTYVVQTYEGFQRIGTDGTGGGPPGLSSASVAMTTGFYPGICDAGGCTVVMRSRREDQSYGASIVRIDDHGTHFTMSETPVANFTYPHWGWSGYGPSASAFPLDAGRPLVVHNVQRPNAPYAGVKRLMVTAVGTPRTRAVAH